MKTYDVVVAGYLGVDMVPQFQPAEEAAKAISDVLRPGRLIEVDGMEVTLGGVVANTGLAMKRFSNKVLLNGLVGDDFIGNIVRERLGSCGLMEGIGTSRHKGTAFGIVLAPPGVDRIFLESPGCNEVFGLQDIDYAAIAESRLFHFGYPPLLKQFYQNEGAALQEMFARIHQMGVLTSLDFSLPDPESESGRVDWESVLKKTLPFVDIFVPSLEELMQAIMPGKYADILEEVGEGDVIDRIPLDMILEAGAKILSFGTRILLIKAGHRGIYLMTGNVGAINEKNDVHLEASVWNNRLLYCPACPVDNAKVKNASGAGDTAAAAFFTAILRSESIRSALKYAALAGRNNLYCSDIYDELADWDEMTVELQSIVQPVEDLALSAEKKYKVIT